MKAAFHRSLLTGLTCWLLSGCAGIEGPAVVDMVRTIDNSEGITSEDYEQLTDVSDLVFQQNGMGIPSPQRQVYPMEWPPSKDETLRIGGSSQTLQAEESESIGEAP